MSTPTVNAMVRGAQLDVPSTYKTVVLKPNMVDGKNILTQEMIDSANTKYVIKWDYDLKGETITIPENCVLQFDGGSITNGIVTLNEDTIVDDVLRSAGDSDNRPIIAHKGFMYFDTELCIPVWFNGSKWIKADGTDADIANNEQI